MIVKVHPTIISENQTIKIPPSKSLAHRAIICASLSDGKSIISNIDYSIDIKTTIEAMKILGATIKEYTNHVEIEGIKDFNQLKSNTIHCNESGSTLRFLIPLFSLCDTAVHFTGSERLLSRPLHVYEQLFKSQNIDFDSDSEAFTINGTIKAGEITLAGNVSSQFISGLLFSLPFCKNDSIIHILAPFESRSYVDLTIEMLKQFNVEVYFKDDFTLVVKGNQKYHAKDVVVEGDFSQLGFFATLGAINNSLYCVGLNCESLQGDKQLIDIFKSMNIDVEVVKEGYYFKKSNVHGSIIDLNNCPDLGPILCVLSSLAQGDTQIINAERLRIKESDRIAAMELELSKCGVKISSDESQIFIEGLSKIEGGITVFGHNDHRIVMSLAILATICKKPLIIEDAQSISKSYPQFFEDLKNLGVQVEVITHEKH